MLFHTTKTFSPLGGTLDPDPELSFQTRIAYDLPPQGFRIIISEGKRRIEASDENGLFYGRQWINEWMESGNSIVCGIWTDWPDYLIRGYMLDCSRCRMPRMDHLFRLVKLLSKFRYNHLQLYTEHVFAYEKHREVWQDADPFTKEEISELQDYCWRHHISLSPNQNSFGHMERWLKHPSYQSLAECPDGFVHPSGERRQFGSVITPNEEGLKFVEELYGELLPSFSSGWFNVGCDEPWELGKGRSAHRVEREGKHEVYLDFLNKLNTLVKNHKKRMLYWADILLERPDLIHLAPEDGIPIIWGYDPGHPFDSHCLALRDARRSFWVAPGDASWRCFSGRLQTTLQNQAEAASIGLKKGAVGYLLTHWGDLGHHQTWPTALPGLVIGGMQSWRVRDLSIDILKDSLDKHVLKAKKGSAAKILLEMSDLDSRVPKVKCGSWFHPALFDKAQPITHEKVEFLLLEINHLLEQLEHCEAEADDWSWVKVEMEHGLEMTRAAILRSVHRTTDIHLENLTKTHSDLWLNRSRPGGLEESLSYFNKI